MTKLVSIFIININLIEIDKTSNPFETFCIKSNSKNKRDIETEIKSNIMVNTSINMILNSEDFFNSIKDSCFCKFFSLSISN